MLGLIDYTEEELVKSLRNNQREGFEFFYDHYSPAIYGLICKIVNDKGLAAIIMEETFLEFWRTVNSYIDQEEKIFIWVLRIARKKANEHLLHQKSDYV